MTRPPTPRRSPALWSLLLVALVAGCKDKDAPPRPRRLTTELIRYEPEPSPYPPIDPATVTPLEVLYLPEVVGEGYRRVPIRMSKPLYSGRWLGLANGDNEFLGPKHVIVNEFRSQPDHLGEGYLVGSVVLNVETGEVVARFDRGRYVQFDFGLAIVFVADDERPYLFDAETEEFVLAVPEGQHDYAYGDNYHLRFSRIGRYVWVHAVDDEGTNHLYAWQDLSAPPELPNNPFPFAPDDWDPMHSRYRSAVDAEEVAERIGDDEGCTRAILQPPKGWLCLDDLELEDSRPISQGWRLDETNSQVFNIHDEQGYDLSSLCPEKDHPVFASIQYRSPPQLEVRCKGDKGSWMLWEPPDRVRRLDPKYVPRLNKELSLIRHDGLVELRKYQPGVLTNFNPELRVRELVGADYDCPALSFRPGSTAGSAVVCNPDGGRVRWVEVTSDDLHVRSRRFRAVAVVAGANGDVVGIVRRGGRDHVVRLSLGI